MEVRVSGIKVGFDGHEILSVTPVARELNENLIDYEGKPYIEDESFPAGGGLDKRCHGNGDALYSFYTLKDRYAIFDYLKATGWELSSAGSDIEVWVRGNTRITFEVYDWAATLWAYVYTEFLG